MKKSLTNPKRVLTGVAVALLICSLLPTHWARVLTRQPRDILAAAMLPANHLLKPVADKLRRPPDLPVDLGGREEYERAQQQIIELQFRLSQATQQLAELTQIRTELKLVGVKLLPATVTAWSGDPLHPTLTINRGSRHNLQPGQVVARGFNLVGRIVNAGPTVATVDLITGLQTYLIVVIRPSAGGTPVREMVMQIQAAKHGSEFWADAEAGDPIRVGDLAHLYDDAWPTQARGLVVGKVVRVDNHPDDPILRRRVVVVPIRSLAHLDHVTVIIPTEASPPQRQRGNP